MEILCQYKLIENFERTMCVYVWRSVPMWCKKNLLLQCNEMNWPKVSGALRQKTVLLNNSVYSCGICTKSCFKLSSVKQGTRMELCDKVHYWTKHSTHTTYVHVVAFLLYIYKSHEVFCSHETKTKTKLHILSVAERVRKPKWKTHTHTHIYSTSNNSPVLSLIREIWNSAIEVHFRVNKMYLFVFLHRDTNDGNTAHMLTVYGQTHLRHFDVKSAIKIFSCEKKSLEDTKSSKWRKYGKKWTLKKNQLRNNTHQLNDQQREIAERKSEGERRR